MGSGRGKEGEGESERERERVGSCAYMHYKGGPAQTWPWSPASSESFGRQLALVPGPRLA